MTRSGLMAGAAALALLMATPVASFAQQTNTGMHVGGGGGGAHIGGGGGAARIGGGGGGAMRIGGGGINAGAQVAAGPRIGGGNWAGGRTAWNGGGGGWHGGGGGWHHGHRGGWVPGAVAGAVVGGAIAANSYAYYGGPGYYDYGPDYYADNTYYDSGPEVAVVQGGGDPSYCAQRYRSWDPASGTYLGYDGQRHPCP